MDTGGFPTWFLQLLAVLGGTLVWGLAFAGYAYRRRRYRVFRRGLRGHALVVDVRPISMIQRYSAIESPKDKVVVATAALPRGVPTDQTFPRGQLHVGQVVPVVQAPGDPHRIYVDLPGQEVHGGAASHMNFHLTPVLLVAIPLGVVWFVVRLGMG